MKDVIGIIFIAMFLFGVVALIGFSSGVFEYFNSIALGASLFLICMGFIVSGVFISHFVRGY